MNPMILGGYSRWLSPLLHSSLLLLLLQVVLDLKDSYDGMVSAFWIFTFFNDFLRSYYDFYTSLKIAWSRNQNIFGVFRETLVVQVDS